MTDVMLDFESFGTGPYACLSQVGAVYFDKATGELGDSFSRNIDARTHVKAGGVIDADTVYWWLGQEEAAQDRIRATGQDITEVMNDLNVFLSKASRIWSHATFDFVLLINHMKLLGIKPLFSYKTGMDIRTLVYLARGSVSDYPRIGVHHDALDDAKHQVKYCVGALNKLKLDKKLIAALEGLK